MTEDSIGTTGRTAIVHKEGAEGSIVIDAITGQVLTPAGDRPEWAESLGAALLAERHGFYNQRLGAKYADEHKHPEALAYQDLGWVAVDEEGAEVELDADAEYRMSVVAENLGIDRETGVMTTKTGERVTKVEVEMAHDQTRTADEAKALDDAQDHGFGELKTGTEGK